MFRRSSTNLTFKSIIFVNIICIVLWENTYLKTTCLNLIKPKLLFTVTSHLATFSSWSKLNKCKYGVLTYERLEKPNQQWLSYSGNLIYTYQLSVPFETSYHILKKKTNLI